METQEKSQIIETEICSRCCGTGNYSYCQSYGTRCFKCHGTGKQLTKRGKIVQARYNELRTLDAMDIKVGMRIKFDLFGSGYITGTIKTATTGEDCNGPHMTFETNGGKSAQFGKGCTVYLVPTGERLAEIRAELTALRDNLTLAGTPRKKSR